MFFKAKTLLGVSWGWPTIARGPSNGFLGVLICVVLGPNDKKSLGCSDCKFLIVCSCILLSDHMSKVFRKPCLGKPSSAPKSEFRRVKKHRLNRYCGKTSLTYQLTNRSFLISFDFTLFVSFIFLD